MVFHLEFSRILIFFKKRKSKKYTKRGEAFGLDATQHMGVGKEGGGVYTTTSTFGHWLERRHILTRRSASSSGWHRFRELAPGHHHHRRWRSWGSGDRRGIAALSSLRPVRLGNTKRWWWWRRRRSGWLPSVPADTEGWGQGCGDRGDG